MMKRMNELDQKYMKSALRLAQKAGAKNEVPVGAVIVCNGQIIGRGFNRRQTRQNALEHAEIMAIAQACRKTGSWRLEDCTLYVTLEPCPMCAGAILQSRIERVVFGACDPKGGAVVSVTRLFDCPTWNHHPVYEGGILEESCAELLRSFFRRRRDENRQRRLQLKGEI